MNPFPNRHARRKALKTMPKMQGKTIEHDDKPIKTSPHRKTPSTNPEEEHAGQDAQEGAARDAARQVSTTAFEPEEPLADSINKPEREFVFVPGKGHTTSHTVEFMAMIVFRLLGVSPPAKGSLRYLKISEDYAEALSPEAAQWLREIAVENPEQSVGVEPGMNLPALLGGRVPPVE